jgi:uncharacterized protein
MQNKLTAKDFVINMLEEKLPASYYYHNVEHSLYVMDKVVEIGSRENCTTKEIDLLSVAALWHDAGYINTYNGHEEESCKLARQYLPEYEYTGKEIDIICGMIMATKIPQSPQNKLEEIIADADLEYLGAGGAYIKANNLFRELQTINPLLSEEKWNEIQISFLKTHRYFTAYCKQIKGPVKLHYLNSLLKNDA